MNRLISLVMVATLAAIVTELAAGEGPAWAAAGSLALAAAATGLAGARIVPSAVRLGTRRATAAQQSAAARSIYRGHLFCG